MPGVYVPETVLQVKQIYGELIFDHRQSVFEHLMILADRLWQAYQQDKPAVYTVISNYHPDFLGAKVESITSKDWTYGDFEDILAIEHGFRNKAAAEQKGTAVLNAAFEQAVDALLRGDSEILKLIIENKPALVKTQSQYAHRATLLHYATSNGVELYRQQVPLNLPEIVQYLLKKGANSKMTMRVYGGDFDVKALLSSSAHPKEAGIMDELLSILP